MAYVQKRGPLNQGMRLEYLLGRISWQMASFMGGKAQFDKIIRYHDKPEHLTDMDVPAEAFAAMFGAKKKELSDGK